MEEKARAAVPQEQAVEKASLLDEIVEASKIKSTDEAYTITRKGVVALIPWLLEPGRERVKVSKSALDNMIAEVDRKLGHQVDAILHHPEFQKLESAWRSLRFLVERTDFRENIRIDILNVNKEDLVNDLLEGEMDITRTGLYGIVYSAEYGQFGGRPYGAMIGNYEFGPGPQDLGLLQKIASVACAAHAPFISAAGPAFFGVTDFTNIPYLKDLKPIFESNQYIKWRSFRDTEDARYVGLTVPRFLLRYPYGPNSLVKVKAFNYEEDVSASHDQYLWGNAAFAFATRLTDSFAKYRMCANIIGPQSGGAVEDLPIHQFEHKGEIQTKIPTEVLISERREYELADEGFIALTMRKGSDNAAFFSANSAQRPKDFPKTAKGMEAKTNYALGTQLPYMFVISRLAHYLKVIQRENIGSWKERKDLRDELNKWIAQYISDQDNPPSRVRSEKPLRWAIVEVEDVPGQPGWYKVSLQVRPHFKYMGAYFTLSLVGKLDKEKK